MEVGSGGLGFWTQREGFRARGAYGSSIPSYEAVLPAGLRGWNEVDMRRMIEQPFSRVGIVTST